jgi:hypothetical protein
VRIPAGAGGETGLKTIQRSGLQLMEQDDRAGRSRQRRPIRAGDDGRPRYLIIAEGDNPDGVWTGDGRARFMPPPERELGGHEAIAAIGSGRRS